MRNPIAIAVLLAALAAAACTSDPAEPGGATLSLSVPSHDFGSIAVGAQSAPRVFRVSNRGEAPSGILAVRITGLHAAEFPVFRDQCSGQALEPGHTCDIEVGLRPASPGVKEVVLTVVNPRGENLTAGIRGNGADIGLGMSPTVHSFNQTMVGALSAAYTLVVRNTRAPRTGPVQIAVTGGNPTDFPIVRDGCSGQTLVLGGSCGIDILFAPAGAGSRQATVTVSASPGGSASTALSGASGVATSLGATPQTQDFGSARTAAPGAAFSFVVSNTGAGPSGLLTPALSGAHPGDFVILSDGCGGYELPPGASCVLELRFSPQADGPRSATLEIRDPFSSGAAMSLAGTGGGTVLLTLSPAAVGFLPVMVGATGGATVVTVTNTGTATSEPLGVFVAVCDYYYYYYGCTPSGTFAISADACSDAVLPPGGSCALSVAFAPVTLGTHYANVVVFEGPTRAIGSLSGVGTGLHLVVFGLDFAPVIAGLVGEPQAVTVTNTGAEPTGPISTGLQGASFQITSDGCAGVLLAAGASCSVSVRFAPQAAGVHAGTLTFSATPGGSRAADLRGLGL